MATQWKLQVLMTSSQRRIYRSSVSIREIEMHNYNRPILATWNNFKYSIIIRPYLRIVYENIFAQNRQKICYLNVTVYQFDHVNCSYIKRTPNSFRLIRYRSLRSSSQACVVILFNRWIANSTRVKVLCWCPRRATPQSDLAQWSWYLKWHKKSWRRSLLSRTSDVGHEWITFQCQLRRPRTCSIQSTMTKSSPCLVRSRRPQESNS